MFGQAATKMLEQTATKILRQLVDIIVFFSRGFMVFSRGKRAPV